MVNHNECRQVRYTWGDECISKSYPIMMNHEGKSLGGFGKKKTSDKYRLSRFQA